MKLFFITSLVTFLFLATACGAQTNPPVNPNEPEPANAGREPDQTVGETVPAPEATTPNCLGDEISPIGQSIADDYESADYVQVITWFCEGAEFEDILVALETEAQTGTPADEMLQMLADDFTWDEIWQLVGLNE